MKRRGREREREKERETFKEISTWKVLLSRSFMIIAET
jgi:hypothetical protein